LALEEAVRRLAIPAVTNGGLGLVVEPGDIAVTVLELRIEAEALLELRPQAEHRYSPHTLPHRGRGRSVTRSYKNLRDLSSQKRVPLVVHVVGLVKRRRAARPLPGRDGIVGIKHLQAVLAGAGQHWACHAAFFLSIRWR